MKSNITLIGMPGAGKSTTGIILAKILAMGFIDTDVLIQINEQRTLQQILDSDGYLALRRIEEQEILRLNVSHQVIATGGSAIYSHAAMTHLQQISTIVYIDVPYHELCRRIDNFASRGIARASNQSFADLYHERQPLYQRYADLTIADTGQNQELVAQQIAADVRQHCTSLLHDGNQTCQQSNQLNR